MYAEKYQVLEQGDALELPMNPGECNKCNANFQHLLLCFVLLKQLFRRCGLCVATKIHILSYDLNLKYASSCSHYF